MLRVLFKLLGWAVLGTLLAVSFVLIGLWAWNLFVDEPPNEEVHFGVTFSDYYARELGLDWQEAYLAILDDLGVRRIRVAAYWRDIEPEPGVFDYSALDFQIEEAAKRDAEIILAVGQKLPRWPECHIPGWAKESPDRPEALLGYIEKTVLRYKDAENIVYVQVENEPFLGGGFGDCPPFDADLLDREIELVRSLDSRPILTTDSGELGDWVRARNRGDVFGTTMYRSVWFKRTIPFTYPLPPTWFPFKKFMTDFLVDDGAANDIVVVELQAEAWGRDPIPYIPLEDQYKYMSFEDFQENIVYGKRSGIGDLYLWGVEWWYRLKTQNNDPRFWEYAKILF